MAALRHKGDVPPSSVISAVHISRGVGGKEDREAGKMTSARVKPTTPPLLVA